MFMGGVEVMKQLEPEVTYIGLSLGFAKRVT